ncbi:DUF4101 domain-containing protein [Glaciihabitans arcticus]|uniref:DUF4101 domain-containing protein n=1 Tax=Glaciihabitans arcticus TaxID=2668039 RepID=A0A4Q9GTE5_9MICO|nr:IMS domain-containing protein [Glaciihabitans arcticus]TBN57991.1 DUF4101 domain-containing protein [Glaciihabitans arcticus]
MTTHDSVGTAPTRRGLTRALVLVLVVALALLATAFAISAGRAPAEKAEAPAPAAAQPTATPEPTLVPATDVGITPVMADLAVAGFLTAVATTPASDLPKVASGAILEDLQNEAQELEANGWTRTGRAKVDGVKVTSSNEAAGTATVVACVDSSKVATLDENGDRLAAPATARALNIYSLSRSDGFWRVVSRTFPDETAC